MFSVKEQQPGAEGHRMHECVEYDVLTTAVGKSVVMKLKDGTTKTLEIPRGGIAFVMNDGGKTIDIINPSPSPRTAQMRGGR